MRHRVVVLCASLAVAFAVYAAESDPFTPAQRNFWSLQPVKTPGRARGQESGVGQESDRRLRPREARREDSDAQPARRPPHAAAARDHRHDRPAAYAGRDPAVPERQVAQRLRESGGSSARLARLTASAGRATGWTSSATPTATASRPMRRGPTSGAIATTSSKPSTTTSRTTGSSRNRSRATRFIPEIPKRWSPWDSIATGSMRPTPPLCSLAARKRWTT